MASVTIVTPTFNRGYIINQLYDSLVHQTCKDFEWLVIDDGSNDNTEELFKSYLSKSYEFTIEYIKQPNGGKHRALNKALELAKGKLFFIVDSDDRLMPDAIEKVVNWANSIDDPNLGGIVGLRGRSANEPHGTSFLGNYLDISYLERSDHNIDGDKAEIFFTNKLNQYRFKEFDQETFLTEATLWLDFGFKYKMRYYNEIIYIGDYLNDGLSANIVEINAKTPKGTAFYIRQKIKYGNLSLKEILGLYYYYGQSYKKYLPKEDIVNNLGISRLVFLAANMVYGFVKIIRRK